MKSCYVNVDKLIGIVELEAPDDINVGDRVISELDKGTCLGTVMTNPLDTSKEGLRKISRKATEEELTEYQALKEKEQHAFEFCKQKISDMNLPMKLLSAEYLFGNTKLLFYLFQKAGSISENWSRNWQRNLKSELS